MKPDTLKNKILSYHNEAKFGFVELERYIKKLPKGSCILEIGCGSGFLLEVFKKKFKSLNFVGIEPSNLYMDYTKLHNNKNSKIQIIKKKYEEIVFKKKFDCIYLINVLEHTSDEKIIIKKIFNDLNRSGKAIILCPNYSFPIESHFKLPIIYSKKITFNVFRKSILKKEKAFNYQGLWESINFINHKNIYEYSNKLGFTTKNDLNINLRLIKRLYKDKTFKSRNYIYYLLLQFVPLKLIRYIFNLKIFEFKLPYIKLILLKK